MYECTKACTNNVQNCQSKKSWTKISILNYFCWLTRPDFCPSWNLLIISSVMKQIVSWPSLKILWPSFHISWPSFKISWPSLKISWPSLKISWPSLKIHDRFWKFHDLLGKFQYQVFPFSSGKYFRTVRLTLFKTKGRSDAECINLLSGIPPKKDKWSHFDLKNKKYTFPK